VPLPPGSVTRTTAAAGAPFNSPVARWSVRVTDISGRVIEQYNKVSANTSVKVGQKLSAGSYYVEVIQGDQRKFLKIIKTN